MGLMKIWGVEVRINVLLCIVLVILFLYGHIENTMIAFIVVLLHEGAHTVIAKTLDYNIKNIEIFPFGGVARISETIAINPWHEIVIAVAGPAFNLFIVWISYNLSYIFQLSNELFIFFVNVNLMIGIFNLLPIIPLDGGRIVRAYLAFLLGIKKATKFVVWISKILSIILFLWGCFHIHYYKLNMFIPMIAIFLFIAAHREYQMAAFIFMKDIIQKKQYLLSKRVLNTKYLVAIKSTTVKDIMNQFAPRKYHIVTVMDNHCNVIGLLTESEILEGMTRHGLNISLEKLLTDR